MITKYTRINFWPGQYSLREHPVFAALVSPSGEKRQPEIRLLTQATGSIAASYSSNT